MTNVKKQLGIPEAAQQDSASFELLNVWIANNGQHVSIRADVWEDPAAWGIMLADLVQHIAASYEPSSITDQKRVLDRVIDGFVAEMKAPTDTPTGQVS